MDEDRLMHWCLELVGRQKEMRKDQSEMVRHDAATTGVGRDIEELLWTKNYGETCLQ
jgi:hypothetical protein